MSTFPDGTDQHGGGARLRPLDWYRWYRDIERGQGLTAPFQGRDIDVPAPYMTGDGDMVQAMRGVPEPVGGLAEVAPRPHAGTAPPGCGHGTRQERPRRSTSHCRTSLTHPKANG